MNRAVPLLLAASLAFASGSAVAQNTRSVGAGVNAQLSQLLRDGYEIKAGFAEAGVPYVLLQKGASAYLCRGAGAQTCEQLN